MIKHGYESGYIDITYPPYDDDGQGQPIIYRIDEEKDLLDYISKKPLFEFNETSRSKEYFFEGYKISIINILNKYRINIENSYLKSLLKNETPYSKKLDDVNNVYYGIYLRYKSLSNWHRIILYNEIEIKNWKKKLKYNYKSEGFRECVYNCIYNDSIIKSINKIISISKDKLVSYQPKYISVIDIINLFKENIIIRHGNSDVSKVYVLQLNNIEAIEVFISCKGPFFTIRYIQIEGEYFYEIHNYSNKIENIIKRIKNYLNNKYFYLNWTEVNINYETSNNEFETTCNLRNWLFDGSNGEDRYYSTIIPFDFDIGRIRKS